MTWGAGIEASGLTLPFGKRVVYLPTWFYGYPLAGCSLLGSVMPRTFSRLGVVGTTGGAGYVWSMGGRSREQLRRACLFLLVYLFQYFPCTGESGVDVGANIFFADGLGKAGFDEGLAHAVVHAGEDDADFLLVREPIKAFEVVQPGGVHEGYFPHADDADEGLVADDFHALVEFVGDAEEEGTVDFIYFHAGRHGKFFVFMGDFALAGEVYHVFGDGYFRGFAHPFHEEHHGEQQPDFDGNGEVEDDREEESRDEHCHIRTGVLHE